MKLKDDFLEKLNSAINDFRITKNIFGTPGASTPADVNTMLHEIVKHTILLSTNNPGITVEQAMTDLQQLGGGWTRQIKNSYDNLYALHLKITDIHKQTAISDHAEKQRFFVWRLATTFGIGIMFIMLAKLASYAGMEFIFLHKKTPPPCLSSQPQKECSLYSINGQLFWMAPAKGQSEKTDEADLAIPPNITKMMEVMDFPWSK